MPPLHYVSTSGESLDLKAVDLTRDGLLHGRARIAPDNVVVTHVWGPCPRCKDPIDVLQAHLPTGDDPQSDGTLPFTVEVACRCDRVQHPGAPSTGGCGASFRLEVPFSDPNLF